MKVKIGDKIYDSALEPIMLILSETDKANIGYMTKHASKFCSYPDRTSMKDIENFMSEGGTGSMSR